MTPDRTLRFALRNLVSWFLLGAWPTAAETIAPTSMGMRVTGYSLEQGGGIAVTESFSPIPVGPFSVIDALDARAPMGYVVDVAASFPLTSLAPGTPLTFRTAVTEVWSYASATGLLVEFFGSGGAVSIESLSGLSPDEPERTLTIAMGDYRDDPLRFDFDVTQAVAQIRMEGHDHLGVRLQADGGPRAGYVSIGQLLLGTSPMAIPEPRSSTLLVLAAACQGILGPSRRVRIGRTRAAPRLS